MNKEENKNKDSIIGIDLGTCLIKVAHWNNGKP
jgi:molecular chaperone DnaK (HSP70)